MKTKSTEFSSVVRGLRTQLFATSFLILFLELALIRYIPSLITYFGYYANFILLASFAGIGIGTLLGRRPYSLHPLFPWVLLLLLLFSTTLSFSVRPDANGEVRFTSNTPGVVLPDFILVPLVFALTAATFAMIAQYLGQLLNAGPPLLVYTWDILGSLSGVAAFAILAFLHTPPQVWFAVVVVVFLLLPRTGPRPLKWVGIVTLVVVVGIAAATSAGQRWSPYQKVSVVRVPGAAPGTGEKYRLMVNNIAHQVLIQDAAAMDPLYMMPYRAVRDARFERALVIGAGTGNDVAVALANGVRHVDAVEIDPVVLEVGRTLHPNRPYDDPRVTTIVDDGRAFLRRAQGTYDLIVFALPDSLVLAASHGNLRLESYLFTEEAFADARALLEPDGLLAVYNYYRERWLLEKISGMVTGAFGRSSYTYFESRRQLPGVVLNGGRSAELAADAPPSVPVPDAPPPSTDAWPFLYLPRPSLPPHYLAMLVLVGVFVLFGVAIAAGRSALRRIEPTYFFLGVAFLLLETKSIAQFALLFGSTWIVNALVFFAILALVLLAVLFVERFRVGSLTPWYAALAVALILQFTVPLSAILPLAPMARYVFGTFLTLSPVFIANVIFARTFRDSTHNASNFASNLLGATVGGALEYAAMLIGYRYLVFVILAAYALAFLAPRFRQALLPSPVR